MPSTAQAPPRDATNEELIRWSFARLDARDVDAMRQLWTADTVLRLPDGIRRGPQEMAAFFKEMFAAVDGWHMEPVAVVADADHVFVRWLLTGTHTGRAFGIEATGRPLAIDGMDHFVVRDGRIVSNFVVYDQMQFARAVGMMPPDGSPADKAVKGAFNAKTRIAARLRRA